MNKEFIDEGLTQLYRIPNGVTYAYGTLICENNNLEELTDTNNKSKTIGQCLINQYPYLRTIKLNNNALSKITINEIKPLTYLLEMQVRGNMISDIEFLT